MGILVRRKKTWRCSARKVMEFGQLMTDILVNVSCKFEMYILKVVQVISENVRIAFLYVPSIISACSLVSRKAHPPLMNDFIWTQLCVFQLSKGIQYFARVIPYK